MRILSAGCYAHVNSMLTIVFYRRRCVRFLPALALIVFASISAHAQLPFYTDDADTTPKGKFHLELSNEHDWLQKSSLPGERQNTTVLTVNYEIGRAHV